MSHVCGKILSACSVAPVCTISLSKPLAGVQTSLKMPSLIGRALILLYSSRSPHISVEVHTNFAQLDLSIDSTIPGCLWSFDRGGKISSEMGAYSRIAAVSVMTLVAISSVIEAAEATKLPTPDFYRRSCPQLFPIVKAEVRRAVAKEPRMAASLIRLHFHDCFVQGCDGSILLDNATGIFTEKDALANNRGSARGFEVIDAIKAALEKSCPNTVSCADILAVTSRDSAVEVGLARPYPVFLGRRDSLNASVAEANTNLPSPFSVYVELKQNFAVQGLDERDLIALSGAHTIGRVRCQLVNFFLNDTDSSAAFKDGLRRACPQDNVTEALEVLKNLDARTPDTFDNRFYRNLQSGEGILRSDQTLWSTPGPHTRLVEAFARNRELFFHQFAASTIKMGNIRPLTGDQGEIRKNCRKRNSDLESSLVAARVRDTISSSE